MRSTHIDGHPQPDSSVSSLGMRSYSARGTGPDVDIAPVGSRLLCDSGMWSALHAHLIRDGVEQAAVVYAKSAMSVCAVQLNAFRVELLHAIDFEVQSAVHIALTDDAQQRIIKTAWDLDAAIVEFHSHVNPRYPAAFSSSDRAGFADFVPHVWWRLQGKPYAAVVVAPGSIDALVWRNDPRRAEPLAGIDLQDLQNGRNAGGVATLIPTGLTYELLSRSSRDEDPLRRDATGRVQGTTANSDESRSACRSEVSDE